MGSFWAAIEPTVVNALITLIPVAAAALGAWFRAHTQATTVAAAIAAAPPSEASQHIAARQAVADMHPLMRPGAARTEKLIAAARKR